jgi:hypothetical protein
MGKKRATKAVTKRSRENDNEQASPPLKKATGSSNTGAKVSAKPAPRKPAKKKPTPPPLAPSTRPSRNRRAPERYENLENAKAPKTPQVSHVKKAASKVFDPVFITTASTSRLVKADVYHMLLEPAAWSSLSNHQQDTLVSMLPPSSRNKALLATIKGQKTEATRPQEFTMSNDCFRTDVAKFKQDLMNGHLAKTWQAAAEKAVIARAVGEYDAWKAEEAESWWGQKSSSTTK